MHLVDEKAGEEYLDRRELSQDEQVATEKLRDSIDEALEMKYAGLVKRGIISIATNKTYDVGDPFLTVQPIAAGAGRIELCADVRAIYMFVGPRPISFDIADKEEIARSNNAALIEKVIDIVDAVANGRWQDRLYIDENGDKVAYAQIQGEKRTYEVGPTVCNYSTWDVGDIPVAPYEPV